MKRVFILPNLFTAANLFLGVLAIIESIRASTDEGKSAIYACWFILAAAVMDALDGKVARVMKAESDFGLQFDSLADLISFGAAPAFLIYITFLQDMGNQHLAALATITFVICGALRLARFNVQVGDEEKKSFTGLPIPAAACMVVSAFLVLREYGDPLYMIKGLPVLMIVLALLMVSKISYPSFKSLPLEKAKSFQVLFYIVLVGCLLYGLKDFKEILIFLLFLSYLGFGVYCEIFQSVTGRRLPISEALDESADETSSEQDIP